MKVVYSSNIDSVFDPCVATVGIFDGVHAGHLFLIEELRSLAIKRNLESVVITFAQHPRKILNADFKAELITSLSEKITQIEATKVDKCIVFDFTLEIAQLSAYDFIKNILFDKFKVQTLLVGYDHRFGHNREDGFSEYKLYGNSLGMEVMQAIRYKTDQDEYICSTEIRQALLAGEIERANRLLTHPYSITGKVVEGFKVGRTIGFPTANIKPNDPDKLIPQKGVYHVRVCWNNRHYIGMLNIGTRPTIDNGENTSIEVYIIDFDENIYNQTIEITFIQKIRDEKKFNGIAELTAQLQADKAFVINLNK
jgi:riboflavin kinase/FMN adenylyltransferase